MANTSLRLMEDVNDGNIPSVYLLQFLGLKMIQYISLLIPISLFFGILISLNRFYASNEIIIMKLNGYSSWAIAKILSKYIIFASLLVMIFNFFLAPLAFDTRERLQHQITHEKKIYTFKENNFNISTDKSKVLFVESLDGAYIPNVFVKSISETSERIDISNSISFTESDDSKITLNNGVSYIFKNDGSYSLTNYLNQDILLINNVPAFKSENIKSKSIYDLQLSENLEAQSESYNRISLIIATIILGFLSIPLSHINNRDDSYKNIFIASIFYFSYIILINIITKSIYAEQSLFLLLILIHTIYLLLTISMYKPQLSHKK